MFAMWITAIEEYVSSQSSLLDLKISKYTISLGNTSYMIRVTFSCTNRRITIKYLTLENIVLFLFSAAHEMSIHDFPTETF